MSVDFTNTNLSPYHPSWVADSERYATEWINAHGSRYESRGQCDQGAIWSQLRIGKLSEFCAWSVFGGSGPDLAIRGKEAQTHDVDLPILGVNIKTLRRYNGIWSSVFEMTDPKLENREAAWSFVQHEDDAGLVYPPLRTKYFDSRLSEMEIPRLRSNKKALHLAELLKAYSAQESHEPVIATSLPWW